MNALELFNYRWRCENSQWCGYRELFVVVMLDDECVIALGASCAFYGPAVDFLNNFTRISKTK